METDTEEVAAAEELDDAEADSAVTAVAVPD